MITKVRQTETFIYFFYFISFVLFHLYVTLQYVSHDFTTQRTELILFRGEVCNRRAFGVGSSLDI
jgi:hypothetical protein